MSDDITRRSFLLRSAFATGALALEGVLPGQPGEPKMTDWPRPCAPGAWHKHGIILEATEPWEGSDIQNFTSRAEPLSDGAWRIWYSCSSDGGYGLAYAEGVPGRAMKKVAARCSAGDPADALFSIGNLPEKWLPVQGTHIELSDGLRFETRKRVIQRDAEDPVDQQFYYLSVTRTARGCVGLLGHYRCRAQTMDLEWCYSADGSHWRRPLRRAWLERGQPPAADCYGIYGPNQLVQRDGKWHLFYTGVNSAHNGRHAHGKPRQVIMYATADSIWA